VTSHPLVVRHVVEQLCVELPLWVGQIVWQDDPVWVVYPELLDDVNNVELVGLELEGSL